jgi:hypothetical protein
MMVNNAGAPSQAEDVVNIGRSRPLKMIRRKWANIDGVTRQAATSGDLGKRTIWVGGGQTGDKGIVVLVIASSTCNGV